MTNFTTLREAADQWGVLMGSQFKHDLVTGDTAVPEYMKVHTEQYEISVVGNDCKWTATQQGENKFDLTKCLESFAYAQSAKQEFRGHNLCWGNNNPKWLLEGGYSKDQLDGLLKNHITTVMQGIKQQGKVHAWDVVNEAIGWVAEEHKWGFKNVEPWYPTLPNYVDLAFTYAKAADPDSLLFYNDFDVVNTHGKKMAIYEMAKDMKKRGIPIDGIGLQMHLKPEKMPAKADIVEAIQLYGSIGLQVHITELDVACDRCISKEKDALEWQAEIYRYVLEACLENGSICTAFLTWGFTDFSTWLGSDKHPLPFDEEYRAKPAYDAMLDLLNGKTYTEKEFLQ